MEKIKILMLEAFTQANQTLKTPKRLHLQKLQAVDVETVPMSEEQLKRFSSLEALTLDDKGEFLEAKIQNGLCMVFAEWNQLESTFHMIHLKFNGTAMGEQRY